MPRKLPKDLTEHRKDQIRELRARCYSPSQVVQAMKADWNVGERRVWHYIALVDKDLAKHGASLPVYERRIIESQVIEGLQHTVRDAHEAAMDATVAQGVRALNRTIVIRGLVELGKAMGMFADRVELAGAGGGPLVLSVSDARGRVQKQLEKIVELAVAAPPPPAALP